MSLFVTNVLIHVKPVKESRRAYDVSYTLYNTIHGTFINISEDKLKQRLLDKKDKEEVVNAKLVLKEDASNSTSFYDLNRYEIKGKTGSFEKFFAKFREYQKAKCEHAYMTHGVPEYYTVLYSYYNDTVLSYRVIGSKNGVGNVTEDELRKIISDGLAINAKLYKDRIMGINWTIPEKSTAKNLDVVDEEEFKKKKVKAMLDLRNSKSYEMAALIDSTLLNLFAYEGFKDIKYSISIKNEVEKDSKGVFKYGDKSPFSDNMSKVVVDLDKNNGLSKLTVQIMCNLSTYKYSIDFTPKMYKTREYNDMALVINNLIASVRDFYNVN